MTLGDSEWALREFGEREVGADVRPRRLQYGRQNNAAETMSDDCKRDVLCKTSSH